MKGEFHHTLLTIHIICGIIVWVTGFIQIIVKKGTRNHQIIGRIYFYCMFGLLLTGVFLAQLTIMLLGIFSYYYNLTGYRFARLKNNTHTWFDKSVIIIGLLTSIFMISNGFYFYIIKEYLQSVLLTFFGLIFIINVIGDFKKYVLRKTVIDNYGKMNWIFEHFGRMFISYMTALTAFTVINNFFKIELLNWILPTIIGTTCIMIAKKHYEKLYSIDNTIAEN